MPDNKKLKGGHDRRKVAAGEDYEIDYFKEKFHVSNQQVTGAIRAVDNDRKKLEAYLKEKQDELIQLSYCLARSLLVGQ